MDQPYIDPNSGAASQPGGVAIPFLGDQAGEVVDLGVLAEEPDTPRRRRAKKGVESDAPVAVDEQV